MHAIIATVSQPRRVDAGTDSRTSSTEFNWHHAPRQTASKQETRVKSIRSQSLMKTNGRRSNAQKTPK